VIVLRFWHQLSEQETAQALGNSVGTVKARPAARPGGIGRFIVRSPVTAAPGHGRVNGHDANQTNTPHVPAGYRKVTAPAGFR
jgi:hypothetical protein